MADALRTIRLYGVLGARFGRVHRLAVKSPAEAVRALCIMVKGFEAFLMHAKDRGLTFSVLVGKRQMAAEDLRQPGGAEAIRIAPVIIGSKQGGLLQTILGAVLVVVGAYFHITPLIQLGVSLIAGGVIQLLSPHPKAQGAGDKAVNTPNYAFNGTVNTEAQGNPIPVFYGGPKKIGSAVVSAGIIAAADTVYVPTPTSAGDGGLGSSGPVLTGSMGGGGGAGGELAP